MLAFVILFDLHTDRKGVPFDGSMLTQLRKKGRPSSIPYTRSISVLCVLPCMLKYAEALVFLEGRRRTCAHHPHGPPGFTGGGGLD